MSKSRSGKTPSSNQSVPPGPAQNAIIPGKFMESDWYELLEIEEDENFIADIIDEITDGALDEVTNNIVKSRVLPHTVLSVRELLLDVIEWEFLRSDPGEEGTNEKLSWIEDEEPCTSVIDNWAQGAVPVVKVVVPLQRTPTPSTPLSSLVESDDVTMSSPSLSSDVVSTVGEELMDISKLDIHDDDDEGCVEESTNMDMEDSVMSVSVQMKQSLNISEESSEQSLNLPPKPPQGTRCGHQKNKSKKYRPHVGQLPIFEKISLESVTDLRPKPGTGMVERGEGGSDMGLPSELWIRNQYGRASGPKEVVYDENGKVVKVEKLNVSHFPNHRVPVKYCVVDSEPEANTTANHHRGPRGYNNTTTGKPQHDLNHNNQKNHKTRGINASTLLQRINPPLSTWSPATPASGCHYDNSTVGFNSLQPRSPLPPLMVDSMNVTDGVTIREGGLSKQVIKKSALESIATNTNNHRTMLPISDQSSRVLNVKDIVADTSPRYITNTA